jgi:hypothetical protein
MSKIKEQKALVEGLANDYGFSDKAKSNIRSTGNTSNKGKRVSVTRVKRTFPIDKDLLETLERAAYWDRTDKNRIIETALDAFFKGKKYEEIPNRQ